MANFQLQRDDLGLLQNRLLRNLRAAAGFRWLRFSTSVVGGVLFGVGASALSKAYDCCTRTQPFIGQFIWFGLTAVAVFVALAFWNKLQLGRAALSNDGWFLAPQSIAVSEEGIDHTTKLGTSRMVWSGFQRLEEDHRNLYLLVEPSLGIIIPKAALAPQELAIVRAKVASAA